MVHAVLCLRVLRAEVHAVATVDVATATALLAQLRTMPHPLPCSFAGMVSKTCTVSLACLTILASGLQGKGSLGSVVLLVRLVTASSAVVRKARSGKTEGVKKGAQQDVQMPKRTPRPNSHYIGPEWNALLSQNGSE